MNAPQTPRCTLARFIPTQMDVEDVKRDGWNQHRILVISADDPRINWMERQVACNAELGCALITVTQ